MYCENCGKKRKDDELFCTECGNPYLRQNNNSIRQKDNNIILILGIISCLFITIPIISIPLAIISIVIGTKNKQPTSKLIPSIISLVLSIIEVIVIVLIVVFAYNQTGYDINNLIEENYYDDYNEMYDYYEDYYENDSSESYDISNHQWLGDDKSFLDLKANNSYIWYENESNREDNYYQGTYQYYTGNDAISYIATHLQAYGLTEYNQRQNIISSNHTINEYYLIILSCEKLVLNGTEQKPTNSLVYYCGYYEQDTNYLDLINISNNSKAGFTQKESTNTIGINKKIQF